MDTCNSRLVNILSTTISPSDPRIAFLACDMAAECLPIVPNVQLKAYTELIQLIRQLAVGDVTRAEVDKRYQEVKATVKGKMQVATFASIHYAQMIPGSDLPMSSLWCCSRSASWAWLRKTGTDYMLMSSPVWKAFQIKHEEMILRYFTAEELVPARGI
jgi:hypothetical protein